MFTISIEAMTDLTEPPALPETDPDLARLLESGLFDADWYQARYRDVGPSGLHPALHYLRYGVLMRRQPSALFDPAGHARRHGLQPGQNPVLNFLGRFGAETALLAGQAMQQTAGRIPVADLAKRFWSGFSGEAQRLMVEAEADPLRKPEERALAAYTLGRWSFIREEPAQVIHWLERAAVHDPELHAKRRILMMIEALITTGDHVRAREMISKGIAGPVPGDFLCALSNLELASARRGAGAPEAVSADALAGPARLAALNAMFRSAGLSPITLAVPEKGLVFGNIAFPPPPGPGEGVEGPKVSVLMPVFNAEDFLHVAMQSLLSQSWRNLEIVAVDDCSTDGTWARLQEFAARDSRLRIFRNEVNMGAYPTRNRALSLCTGDFVTVHDGDDWSHCQMIEAQMRPFLADPAVKATRSYMVRAMPDLRVILRPQRDNLDPIHASFPSFLIRRADLEALGEWDSVSANADSELIQRAIAAWGKDALAEVLPDVALSFFLVHENSLTQAKGTTLASLGFGIRREYVRQCTHWRKTRGGPGNGTTAEGLSLARVSMKDPFPIPQGLAPKHWPRNWHYDVILVSDLSRKGDLLAANAGYIALAQEAGLRVGLVHWPRFDGKPAEILADYLELTYREGVDILVPEDRVTADLVLVHHPAILKHEIDAVPRITAGRVAILADQPPMTFWSQVPSGWDVPAAERLCRRLFGHDPVWIGAFPRVQEMLSGPGFQAAPERIRPEPWFPPMMPDCAAQAQPLLPDGFATARPIRLGRIVTEDGWMAWPARAETIRAAGCAGAAGIAFHLLGKVGTMKKRVGKFPANWQIAPAGTTEADFLQGVDCLVHHGHEEHAAPPLRPVFAALAVGRVVILPPDYRDLFGEAALYAAPGEVEALIRELWQDPAAWLRQVMRGRAFLRSQCGPDAVLARLRQLLPEAVETATGTSRSAA